MALITLRGVGVTTPRPLFQNLAFNLAAGDRIGLVAGNGGGKSTLLRCVAGQADPDQGSIALSRGLRPGYVEQDIPTALLGLTLHEALRRALPPAERDRESWRVGAVLDEFATPGDLRHRPIKHLSGGWQRLALLARVWVANPGALLLDEPTNHLDAAKIAVLESWINGPAARTPMLIASHDRRFLDACTTRTLFLRPDDSPIYAHPYAAARALLASDDEAQDRKHALGQKEVTRLRRNAGELRNIGVNSGSDLLQKKSMQLRARADRLEQTLRPTQAARAGDIRLANRGAHARTIVSFRNVQVSAPNAPPLFHVKQFDLRQGDRLVLLGQNGVGKSQLIALIHRAATTDAPGLKITPSAVIGYADQAMAHLPADQTPHRLISSRPGLADAQATRLLAAAGFAIEAQARPIGALSPGQKARLGLLALRLENPNIYLLDEPTNHIDIPGQERLEAELLAHGATCILASHDRAFIEAVATRFLLIEAGLAREVASP